MEFEQWACLVGMAVAWWMVAQLVMNAVAAKYSWDRRQETEREGWDQQRRSEAALQEQRHYDARMELRLARQLTWDKSAAALLESSEEEPD